VFVSRAPQPDIARVKARMGATMPWYTLTDEFDADFGVDEWHGTNAFIRDGAGSLLAGAGRASLDRDQPPAALARADSTSANPPPLPSRAPSSPTATHPLATKSTGSSSSTRTRRAGRTLPRR